MHHMDASKTYEAKARWELYKNDTCCFEQILETAHYKTAFVRVPASISQTIQVKQTRYAEHS